ncbi:MAG: 4Fe-4S dicluster domain-containing protein [Bacteroidales bacterium]|nr:4Fe-4S dicluster domain-containing protein [Bacteroidales bacterium]
MRKIRIAIAILFFAGITLLFVGVPFLTSWLGWMPKLQFLPAVMALNVLVIVLVLVLTLLFGRIYCSTICPLGVFQDGISRVRVTLGRLRKNRKPFHFRKEHKWLRYGIWVLFVAALAAGVQSFVAILAPYSAYGRIVAGIVHFKAGPVLIVAAATLLVVGLLAFFTGREYCNSICPVGTTLSFFSRFALFRPVIDADKCKNCKLCEVNCKASCIDVANHKIDYSRCVVCFDCIGNCKFDALKYHRYKIAPETKPLDTSRGSGRRAFLAGAAMGLTAIALEAQNKKRDGGFAEVLPKRAIDRETPVTPPGSLSIRDFYKRCTACQLCVTACPNKVLRPSTDLKHLMQPEMGFEDGYCRPECTKCSEVCPSGAIISITPEEKTIYHVGTASVDRSLCVAEKGIKCGNCARHCPVGAIQMVESHDGYMVPTVNTELCIGCGACENLCPSRPVSAITVNGRHDHIIS